MTQELSQQVGAQAQLAALQLQTTLDQTSAPEITRKVERKTTENVGLKRENMDLSMKKWWNSSTDQKKYDQWNEGRQTEHHFASHFWRFPVGFRLGINSGYLEDHDDHPT